MKSESSLQRNKQAWTSASILFAGLTLAICTGSMPVLAQAEDLYEGFDYPADTALDGQNGGTGWQSGWFGGLADATKRFTVANSLEYPGITSTGNKLEIEGSRIFRDLDTELTEGNTYYVRVLMQKDPEEDSMSYFGLMLANDSDTEKLLIGSVSNQSNWMLGGNVPAGAGVKGGEVYPPGHANEGDPTNALTSTVPNTNLALLVVKIEMRAVTPENPDGLEQLTFWINPDLSLAEDVTTAVGGQSFPSFSDYGALSRVRVGGGGTGASGSKHHTDEIHISENTPFPPARHAVDGQIGNKISAFKGDNLYNSSGAGQTVKVKLKDKKNGSPRKGKFYLLAENDGNARDNLRLHAGKSGKIQAKYFQITGDQGNVTAAMATGRLQLNDLRPGEQVRFQSKVVFKKKSKKKRANILCRAYSLGDASKTDAVTAKLKRKKAKKRSR